jgi:glycosyltransferase involved in cell wall biosynthesis
MKLSILICSVNTRIDNFLQEIYKQINWQIKDDVEVLCIIDNKSMTIGRKRNLLIDMAKWDYVVFVDDDDRISHDYIDRLLEWIESWMDVICFDAKISINGWEYKRVQYSRNHVNWENEHYYTRQPNNLMCWKRDIANKVKYENISYWEDTARAKEMISKITSEHRIDEVLYYYEFNEQTSESIKYSNTNSISR